MPQKLPRHLFEKAILPLTIVLAAKFGALFVLAMLSGAQTTLSTQQSGFNLFFWNFNDYATAVWVSTLSDLVASLACALGFTWLLFRAQHFTLANIHPRHAGRIFHRGHNLFLINPSEVISEGLV